jgi:hypothetical protein
MTSNPHALGVLLDAAGDLPDHPRLRSGLEVIAQRVRARTLTHKGEWPLDKRVGIDWIGHLSTKPLDIEGLAADLAVAWLSVPGVLSVTDLTWDVSVAGQATITASLLTVTGETLTPTVGALDADGNPSIVVGGVPSAMSGLVFG